MATVTNINPSSPVERALFNFDEFGWNNFRLNGEIRWSVSDNFEFASYVTTSNPNIQRDLFVPLRTSAESVWTQTELDTLNTALDIISQFANITFSYKGNFENVGSRTIANPADVGVSDVSDINVSKFYRTDIGWAGYSGGGSDTILGYTGASGDVFLNLAYFPYFEQSNFSPFSKVSQVFMHEALHSLGMSHPHTAQARLSADFSALTNLIGPELVQLGFTQATTQTGLYKEYFTVMSYDDQPQIGGSSVRFNAMTPMLLDIIALQSVYGPGRGTHGSGSDTIPAGDGGYRAYYDKGGVDTLDLSQYAQGAFLSLGNSVSFTSLRVGVLMPLLDALQTITTAGDPQHLRWLLGDYENVICGSFNCVILDNTLDNKIYGGTADDTVYFSGGSDLFVGGLGSDKVILPKAQSDYAVRILSTGNHLLTSRTSSQSVEISQVELITFSDKEDVLVSSLQSTADVTPPTAVSFVPSRNATDVSLDSNLLIAFSEPVKFGSGIIYLKTNSGLVVESYDLSKSSSVSILGSTLTINPTANLSSSTQYRIDIPYGAILDISGNAFTGNVDYTFTTKSSGQTKSLVQLGNFSSEGRRPVSVLSETVFGSDFSDSIFGSDTVSQVFLLYSGDDMVSKASASITNDTFFPGLGNDIIFAAGGLDSVIFQGVRSSYTVRKNGAGAVVSSSIEGTDELYGVERLLFSDSVLAFDIDGVAGKAYRIYKAAFNRDPMAGDMKGLGYWIGQLDRGMSLLEASSRFIDSAEFRSLYGTAPTNAQFLTKLYQNVLGRQPEAAGYNWWLNELNTNPEKSKAKVLADFAESPENQSGVISLIGNGIAFDF